MLHHFRKKRVYSLKEEARSSLRCLGSNIWRKLKLPSGDAGIPLTLCNFLDYDDFRIDDTDSSNHAILN